MLGRIFRMLVGIVVACLVAGFTKALFAHPPGGLLGLPSDVRSDRIGQIVDSGFFASIWSFVFALPFAFVAAAIGEWQGVRSSTYYIVMGLGIAVVGFLTQHSAELPGQPTIMNNYGLTAFITAGFLAGLAYWLLAGRSAGGVSPPETAADPVPAGKPAAGKGNPPAKGHSEGGTASKA